MVSFCFFKKFFTSYGCFAVGRVHEAHHITILEVVSPSPFILGLPSPPPPCSWIRSIYAGLIPAAGSLHLLFPQAGKFSLEVNAAASLPKCGFHLDPCRQSSFPSWHKENSHYSRAEVRKLKPVGQICHTACVCTAHRLRTVFILLNNWKEYFITHEKNCKFECL